MQGEQVEPDMSPLTRHEFATSIQSLVKTIRTFRELTQKDIRELTQKDNETQKKIESMEIALNLQQQNTATLFKTTNDLGRDQNYQHARANNLEMKLRKRGGLSKEHAIDYVPYINLPDKHKRGAPSPPPPLSLSHRTRTTIANKYIVSWLSGDHGVELY